MSDEDARARIEAQWATEEKAARADFVIRTGGTLDETRAQIEEVLAQLQP